MKAHEVVGFTAETGEVFCVECVDEDCAETAGEVTPVFASAEGLEELACGLCGTRLSEVEV